MPPFLRMTGLIIYVLVCLVFVAGYLGAYVRPGFFWWLQLPAVFLPYLSLVVLAFTPLFFFPVSRPLLIFQAVLVILMLIRFMPAPGAPGGGGEAQLRVLTFNAKEVYPRIDPATATLELAETYRPHIFALQGGGLLFRGRRLTGTAAPLEKLIEDDWYVSPTPTNLFRPDLLSPVLARNEGEDAGPVLIEQKVFRMPGSEQRVITRAEMDWHGRRFAVYNFHLHSFSLKPWRSSRSLQVYLDQWRITMGIIRRDFQKRAEQTEVVRELLENETLPFIVCGDFNSTPHNWSYRHIARGLKDTQVHGRIFRQSTYHVRLPVLRIDHVLVSHHWRVHDARTLPRTFSDHFPLMVTVSLEDTGM